MLKKINNYPIVIVLIIVSATIVFGAYKMTNFGKEAAREEVITPLEARDIIKNTEVILLDIRTPEEYRAGHIQGAINIDYYSPVFYKQISELDPEKKYVIYCRTGSRTGAAISIFNNLGFNSVQDIAGGITAWRNVGLPIN
jgi:rhodanese-related sulfurtransferase